MKYPECEVCGKWSPRLAFIGNSLVSVFKFVVGFSTGSKGLVADALHSVADATSSLFILIALRIAGKPKDECHPFGHGKVEYISTIFASIFIFICATTIFFDALHSFKNGPQDLPDFPAIFATILCLVYSYLMYSSNSCAGEQLNSPALLADASESKADSFASVAVLLGLIGTRLGFVYADIVAAALVSVLVFHISLEMFIKGVNGLIDVSMDKEVLEEIKEISLGVKGIEGVRGLRSRCMGQKCMVDIDVDVARNKTVLETHHIKDQVREAINEKIEGIDEVFIKAYPVGRWRLWDF